jgi:hypothetical protein
LKKINGYIDIFLAIGFAEMELGKEYDRQCFGNVVK